MSLHSAPSRRVRLVCKVTYSYFGWRAPRWQRLAGWRPSWFYSMEAPTNIAFGCTFTKCVNKCFSWFAPRVLIPTICWLQVSFSGLQFLVAGFGKLSVLLPGSMAAPCLRAQLTCWNPDLSSAMLGRNTVKENGGGTLCMHSLDPSIYTYIIY
jgi:hypothetical protein